jgi:hypothetical protein
MQPGTDRPGKGEGEMSDTQRRASHRAAESYVDLSHRRSGWVEVVIFAGTLLVMLGIFQVIEGLVALFKDDYYLVTSEGMPINVDFTAWGWTQIVIGAIAIVVGLGVLRGQTWARVGGIILAVVSAVVNLAFVPAYPIWATIIIAVDVLVIWALAVHGGETRD